MKAKKVKVTFKGVKNLEDQIQAIVKKDNDKKTQHTPGPWKVSKLKNGGIGVFATDLMYNVLDRTAPIDANANARLIAIAPEMLGTLKSVRLTMNTAGMPVGHIDYVINKAEGR